MNFTHDMRRALDFFARSLPLVTQYRREAARRLGMGENYLGIAARNRNIEEVELALLIADIKALAAIYELRLAPQDEPGAHMLPSTMPLQCDASLAEYVDELARRSQTNAFAEEAYRLRDSSSTIEARRLLDLASCGPKNLREICWAMRGAYHRLDLNNGPFQNILHGLEAAAKLSRPRNRDQNPARRQG